MEGFTLKNLASIIDRLEIICNNYDHEEVNVITAKIKQMTEILIWGEKNDQQMFDLFCERGVLNILLKFVKQNISRFVVLQIIQSLGLFLYNIDKPQHINFIFTNRAQNDFINHDYNFNDDEIVDYYINLLKSCCLRIGNFPLEIFFNERFSHFPLLNQAQRFYNHKESMVRTTMRNIFLSQIRYDSKASKAYILGYPYVKIFIFMALYTRDLWNKIDAILPNQTIENHKTLKDLLDDNIDVLLFYEDLYRLNEPEVSNTLTDTLFTYAILPSIFGSFTMSKKGSLNLQLGVFLLFQIYENITDQIFIDMLSSCILLGKYPVELAEYISNPLSDPEDYYSEWCPKRLFVQDAQIMKKQYFYLKYDNGETDDRFEKLNEVKDIQLSEEQLEEIKEFSRCFDRNLLHFEDNSNKLKKNSVRSILDSNFVSKFSNEVKGKDAIISTTREIIFSLFRSKDDNQILACSSLIESIFKSTSKKLLTSLLYEPINIPHAKTDFLLENAIKLLVLDPPFRIVTCKIISKMLTSIVNHSRENNIELNPVPFIPIMQEYKNNIGNLKKMFEYPKIADIQSEDFEKEARAFEGSKINLVQEKWQYLILLPFMNNSKQKIPWEFTIPNTDAELTKREIHMFLIYKMLRYDICPFDTILLDEEHNFNKRVSEFLTLYPSFNYQNGGIIDIDGRIQKPCYLKQDSEKVPILIMKDQLMFILAKPLSENPKKAQIVFIDQLKHIELAVDRSNPRALMIASINKKADYLVFFDDFVVLIEAKAAIEKSKAQLKHNFRAFLRDIQTKYEADIMF